MAPNDAEMPDHQALKEDIQEIAQRLSTLRHAVENLTRSIGRAGSHQADALQDQASELLCAVEDSVRREPVKSLSIALGAGFLLGVLMRR
ncbi:MAG: DUF883 family protein [Methyloceanibacter sp.]|uniref:DUF883 family protein n=1 Tax=Methyloceanibacter sp. TaxID=1965321 RepID=UPI003D6D92C0